jgi:hypothetical protein
MLKNLRAVSSLVVMLIAIGSVAVLGACEDESPEAEVRLVDVKVNSGVLGHELVGYVENSTQYAVKNVTISIHYYEGESDLPENYRELGTCTIIVTVHPKTKEPFMCGLDNWRDEFRVVSQILNYDGMATLTSPTKSTELKNGVDALNRGEVEDAYNILRPLADQGNAEAQFLIGHMYRTGQGITKDETEAVRWYRLAAEQGNSDGEYMLGAAYAFGSGVPKDYQQAEKWFLRAAKQGDLQAQEALEWIKQQE